ncbi:Patatin/Phospholipase A2-related [Ostreococcus tauri]|uniref:Patatin n=1 Tax=Ostreococcus tauri TaxID=70448 RepID=Q011Z2_OSTTA|nr:Patatin/Phospholipase A2-related [Ostreococcus tauri]OUS49005.1 hypothetical protein BE221DRAFT_67878 [Ostreococcus tauri]CAL55288.1 Patatin/Phospholipase A2-related [Ostreococcus tauri]|eukprot:XP_003081119.1 Patatin/Phospholipase A2-related [Ostreococcus tauri]
MASVPARAAQSTAPAITSKIARCAPTRASRVLARASSSSSSTSSTSSSKEPLGVGFSAAGFVFPQLVGSWEVLVELGVMREDTPVAGASAGSLVAALHACGKTPADGKRILSEVLADTRVNGVVGRVGGVLEKALRANLPTDAHVTCSRGNLFVSVSSPRVVQGERGIEFGLDGELVSSFETYDDLIGALLASCHIPLYCGWPARRYRDKWCVDGGWHNLTPKPLTAEKSIRVCPFPLLDAWRKAQPGDGTETGDVFAQQASFWAGWGDDDAAGLLISPDAAGGQPRPEWDYTKGDTIKYAFLPGSDEILEQMVAIGREDAERWAKTVGYAKNFVEIAVN